MTGFLLAIGTNAAEKPSPAARRAADAVRHEALLPPRGPEGYPLPLLSSWNMGSQDRGWTPDYQCELLDAGHYILPWMGWPSGDPDADERSLKRFMDYYGNLLEYCHTLKLPISFRGTQWEAMLAKSPYRDLPEADCPAVVTPEGEHVGKLSPFGAIDPWRDPADEYVDTPAMKKIQELYPDPPRVFFVSNNEAPRLRWAKHGPLEEQSKRYLDLYGTGRSDEFKRRVVGQGWMERYPVMFNAMREALVNETWKQNLRFVGYGAFGPSHFGRWDGWKVYSLICEEWIDPEPLFWQGGSPSYYTHNWNDNRDHWVFSTQVQGMNWIFMLDRVYEVNPDFWWEVSTWDGNTGGWTPDQGHVEELLGKSKACQYLKDGQTYTPDRHEGWAQFGLWLLRPRVYREFRGSTVPRAPWQAFFDRMIAIVDRVHNNRTLAVFWRKGELVHNRAHRHPYQEDIPERLQDIHRWYLLDTSLDPERPWEQKTNLPVFSMALVTGEAGERQWLVYAHAPLENRAGVDITVPGYGPITVDVPRKGAFFVVDEQAATVKAL
jgi:hypothetical protein